jgi:hypothetical protein
VTVREPRPGDVRWDDKGEVWTFWSGRSWRKARYAAHPRRLKDRTDWSVADEVPDELRRELLDRAAERETLMGGDVRDRRATSCVLGTKHPVNHLGHLVLSVVTVGLWAFIWLVMMLDRREDRVLLSVDRYGNVWVEEP